MNAKCTTDGLQVVRQPIPLAAFEAAQVAVRDTRVLRQVTQAELPRLTKRPSPRADRRVVRIFVLRLVTFY